jgi:hypothetical protein
MNRIAQSHAFTAASLNAALLRPNIQEVLYEATRTSRFDHAIFSIPNPAGDFPFIFWSTLPGSWLSCYLRRSYHTCDAVARIGNSRSKPFFWSDLKLDLREQIFLEESARNGVGPCGYTIPLIRKDGKRALLSISSGTLALGDWTYYIKAIQHELREFAMALHSRALDEILQETAQGGMNCNTLQPEAVLGMDGAAHPVCPSTTYR